MAKRVWLWIWRVLLLVELVGMIVSGLIAAFSWQTLHVTMLALYHQPSLLLDAGTVFVSASIASAVLLVGFICTTPVLLLLEWFAARSHRHAVRLASSAVDGSTVLTGQRCFGRR